MLKPNIVIFINDGKAFTKSEKEKIDKYFKNINYLCLDNNHIKGLAGSLNTGLEYLIKFNFEGYVSILDDDDSWDIEHLNINYNTAKINNADVVISGLRMKQKGIILKRKILTNLISSDFLIGNPGWQGSNTFVSMKIFKKINGFRDGLLSLNDRDIAFRILNITDVMIAYTNTWTANWYFDSQKYSLSMPRSKTKIFGLQWFWYIYQNYFDKYTKKAFFNRAEKYFKIKKSEIVDIKYLPQNTSLKGDLIV